MTIHKEMLPIGMMGWAVAAIMGFMFWRLTWGWRGLLGMIAWAMRLVIWLLLAYLSALLLVGWATG